VPEIRIIAKKYIKADFFIIQKLLQSKIHEHRLCWAIMLVYKYKNSNLHPGETKILDKFSVSANLRERRISIVSTFQLIKNNNFDRRAKRLTYNLTMDYFRQKKRSKILSFNLYINNNKTWSLYEDLFNSDEKSQEELMIQKEDEQMVRKLLEQIPENQREIIVLRMFWNLSFKEIAKKTEVSINTALGRMRYATINFRKILAKKTCKN